MRNYSRIIVVMLSVVMVACSNSKNTSMEDMSEKEIEHPSMNLVDFHAEGGDESWKLSIQWDETLYFSTPEGIHFKGEIQETHVAQGADVVSIFATNSDLYVRVSIDIVDCQKDGKKVDVLIRPEKEKEGENFSGCGFYRGNPKLHDIWAVEAINNDELNPEKFPKDIPHFEINLKEKSLSGFAGCNQVTAPLQFSYNSFTADPLGATKMYCAETSDIEKTILSVLRNQSVHYFFKGNKLILESREGSLTLKKVD